MDYKEDVSDYINKCEKILSDWDNDWCWDFVQGIKDWIEENNYITDKQKESIDNILEKIKE